MSLTLTSSSARTHAAAQGRCTLVDAGPGDPEQLTLGALKAIQSATLLLVDDLVSDDIVNMAAPGARVIRVGKRGGCKSAPQSFIERLMIMAVHEGEHVVRLKGGDPLSLHLTSHRPPVDATASVPLDSPDRPPDAQQLILQP
jgi:uroporphyrin-III C-methyltransferase